MVDGVATCRRLVAARRPLLAAAALLSLVGIAGCRQFPYEPQKAGSAYPFFLPTGPTERIQVFSDGITLELVNASGRSFRDFDLWVNQRYSRFVERLDAGQTLRLPVDTFWDHLGEGPQTGGFFASAAPTPIALVQIQVDEVSPLVGLISVPNPQETP